MEAVTDDGPTQPHPGVAGPFDATGRDRTTTGRAACTHRCRDRVDEHDHPTALLVEGRC